MILFEIELEAGDRDNVVGVMNAVWASITPKILFVEEE